MEIKNGFTKNKKIIWLMCAVALCLSNGVAHAMYKYAKAKQTHFDHTKIKNAFIEKSKMHRLELARVVAATVKDKAKECGDSFFVHEQGTANGICVAPDVLKLSRMLNNMTADIAEGGGGKAIPLEYPVADIDDTFTILKLYQEKNEEMMLQKINNYPLDRLISIANVINYLYCPDVLSSFLDAIKNKNKTQLINNEEFNRSNIDLQKQLMVPSITFCLKESIIKKYENERKRIMKQGAAVFSVAVSFDGQLSACLGVKSLTVWDNKNRSIAFKTPIAIGNTCIAFSPDGTKIVVAGSQQDLGGNNVFVWERAGDSFAHKISFRVHDNVIKSVAFLPDLQHIVLGSYAHPADQYSNNLVIADTETGKKVLDLVGHKNFVNSVAVSFDGKMIASCGEGTDNLILWDISKIDWNNPNSENIEKIIIPNDCKIIMSVAVDNAGNRLATGSSNGQLILWDISDKTKIIKLLNRLIYNEAFITSVALSSDGKSLVVASIIVENNKKQSIVDLWYVNDAKNRTNVRLTTDINSISSVAFGENGNIIIAGGHPPFRHGVSTDPTCVSFELLKPEESFAIDRLDRLQPEQLRLVYRLCFDSLSSVKQLQQDSYEYDVFESLPKDMQKILKNFFWTKKEEEKGLIARVGKWLGW